MSETRFKEVRYDLGGLIKNIQMGDIGLPDLQRPFVWKNAKVRDLFDSMYRGFPVGYFLFWQNALSSAGRAIGTDKKQKFPSLMVVDGQQRLTSLYAVIRGVPVIRSNFSKEKIRIAFNPIDERFAVSDAAVDRDRAFIPDISVLWSEGIDIFDVVDNYFERLKESREITDEERKSIRKNIQKLSGLLSFPFTALELSHTLNDEEVAEVFVRINSKGKTLNQADFILTLMSVFWDQGRRDLEKFCRDSITPSKSEASPFNHFFEPSPDQLLRISVALAFKRARLQYVYSILRGKDLETEQFSDDLRITQFAKLQKAQEKVLNLTYWHDFFKAIDIAGFKGGRFITSKNNLIFAYVLYLMGRTELGVEEKKLKRAIAQWFFMSALTGRYTGSPESAMEADLARFQEATNGEQFVGLIHKICADTMTPDFWKISLPNDLATAASLSPSLSAYYASLVMSKAQALFSDNAAHDLLDPSVHSTRSATERHHLFPKAYLASLGITEHREVNQIANFALAEWSDNALFAGQPPNEYVPLMKEQYSKDQIRSMYVAHALPDDWENMEYKNFLRVRRELMAELIKNAYEGLAGIGEIQLDKSEEIGVTDYVNIGEGKQVEFKSTLRVNLHTGEKDKRMEHAIVRTVAGFLNTNGGTLVIGVDDAGEPIGLNTDMFPSLDSMHLHFDNLLKHNIGAEFSIYVHVRFEDYKDEKAMVIEVLPARSPAFVKDGNSEKFYVRTGASTSELLPSEIDRFSRDRFH